MNKMGKLVLSASILLTGVTFNVVNPEAPVTHAATTPYYTYNGYAGYNAKFVTEKNFINALRYNNITMNKVRVDAKIQTFKSGSPLAFKKKYDQEIEYINKKPVSVTFMVHNKSLKVADVKKAYAGYKMTEDKLHGAIMYNVNGQQISFAYNGKYVEKVMIGRYHA
ncbi:hypothetical protein MTQ89_11340 [Staphylococcus hyicus]|uniref:immunodominant staphylococcal antigen IsaB family protein n=1 Tax=Staphylococcus hyicus TaxID=1284 RepID=UPI00208E847A|nr:hypothetical protein [Staphylococcus hyicus]MCO4329441.1 hypothetical protein [Staphylococcus hyicus]MCO4337327.1 hypothetical protein [Staphylococcus hyicus]